MTLRVAVSFSGGKDSAYATWIAMHQGSDVSLVTVKPCSADSLMFHHPNVEWTRLQAQSMGLFHESVEMTSTDEMTDLQQALAKMKSTREIFGLVTVRLASINRKLHLTTWAMPFGLKP